MVREHRISFSLNAVKTPPEEITERELFALPKP